MKTAILEVDGSIIIPADCSAIKTRRKFREQRA